MGTQSLDMVLDGPAETAGRILASEQPESDRLAAEIAQTCRAHDRYLAIYGSMADAVRLSGDASQPA